MMTSTHGHTLARAARLVVGLGDRRRHRPAGRRRTCVGCAARPRRRAAAAGLMTRVASSAKPVGRDSPARPPAPAAGRRAWPAR